MFLLLLKACFLFAAEFLKGSELEVEKGRAEQAELWDGLAFWLTAPGSQDVWLLHRGLCWGPSSVLMLSCQLASKRIFVSKKRDVFVLN